MQKNVLDAEENENNSWYGFDLDGTLAEFNGWKGIDNIGNPIVSMCNKAKKLHKEGKKIKIFTARVAEINDGKKAADLARKKIQEWSNKYLGFIPEITNEKDCYMKEFYDDSAKQVIRNTGISIEDVVKVNTDAAKKYLGIVSDAREKVKIMVTSDIHTSGMEDIDAKNARIVVIAGDIMGAGYRSDEQGEKFLKNVFIKWCLENEDKEIIVTAGNHDKFLFREWERGKKIEWPKNVHYLIDRGVEIMGIRFWGTPWCTKNRDGRFEASSQELAKIFAKIPKGIDVLVSHTPPCVPGEKIDTYKGGHDGSAELTDAIITKKPKICICGHVHGADREMVLIGDTKVYNVARVEGDRSKAKYKPRLIEI